MNRDFCLKERNCFECAIKSPLCDILNSEELEILNSNRYEIFFKAGETIRKQGTFMSHVISIQSGQCKMYLEGLSNKNIIIRIIQPHSFIGGPGMYIDQKHHYSVTAIIDTVACFIEIDNFKKIMSLNHKFNEAVITEISKNSLSTYNRLINTTQKHMNGRIADVLLYLSDEIYQAREFKLTLSKQDIAELSGMTKDSAVKVLRSFIQEGIITNKSGIIEICDYNSLTRISQIG